MSAWFSPSTPDTIKPEPWLSDAATEKLFGCLSFDMDVLEHGAGGSTLWLAKYVRSVTAYENDADWFRGIAALAPENVTLVMWDKPQPPTLKRKFDLILIDGMPIETRAAWCKKAISWVHPGGVIVLDNCNRPHYEAERELLRSRCAKFETINDKNGLYLNTEFYFMPGRKRE